MTLLEFFGKGGNFPWLVVGILIVLLIYFARRVSALKKRIDALKEKLNSAGTKSVPRFLGAGSNAVPNAVIAAICAAIDQYRIENA